MKIGTSASMVAIVTVFVVGSAYLIFDVVKVDWFTHYTDITMVAPDSGGLLERSPVLLSGIRVGEVDSVGTHGRRAEIKFRVDSRYHLPAAGPVRIESLSGLGEPYLEFTPSREDFAGPAMRNGQIVAADRVQAPVSIPEFAATVTKLLNQLDPHTLESIIDTFSRGLEGTEAVVPNLARSTDLLAATLLSRTTVLRDMLTNVQAITPDLGQAGTELDQAVPAWQQFGPNVDKLAGVVGAWAKNGNIGQDYTTGLGLVPFMDHLMDYLHKSGPDIAELSPAITPLIADATSMVGRLDLSSLIAQALNATDNDGALHLEVGVR
ncbi:MlaD family protein [Nocardia nova]|uniref:MlaD family protein n=1 Tax=Nocardia nova TaxID=37330 RepID=UPI0033C9A031